MDNRIEYNLTAYKKSIQECKEKKAILFMGFDYRYTGNSRYLFEELLNNTKCEILKPFFIEDTPRINIKDYIEELF